MKKLALFIALGTMLSCTSVAQKDKDNGNYGNNDDSWNGKRVVGNGNVVTENRNVGSFTKLDLHGVCNIIITQGSTEQVKVETDENLQSLVLTEVKDGTLTVKHPKKMNWSKSKKMVVYITFKTLTDIKNSSVGNLNSEGNCSFGALNFVNTAVGNTDMELVADNLTINNSAVGNVDLAGKVAVCNFKNSAVGNVDAQDLAINDLTLQNSAVGNFIYNAAKVQGKTSAVGNTKNKNKAGGQVKDTNKYSEED